MFLKLNSFLIKKMLEIYEIEIINIIKLIAKLPIIIAIGKIENKKKNQFFKSIIIYTYKK